MNLNHLKYFYDAARLQSVVKSAEINYVGQPAVSKAIKNLESTLDKPLISHRRNRFLLTEEGEKVFIKSQEIFGAVENLRDVLSQPDHLVGDISFACQSSMAESDFLSTALRKFTNSHRQVNPHILLGRTDLVRNWTLNGAVDVGLVINNIDTTGFDVTTISSGRFYLVKSRSYNGKIERDGVLVTEAKNEVRELKDIYKKKYKKDLPVRMHIGSWSVIKKFALAGIGAGFVPGYLVKKELARKTLVMVDARRLSVPYEILLIVPKSKYVNAKMRALISAFGK